MRLILLAVILGVTSCGCAIVGHLDQLLMLNDYGNNKTAQKKTIKINDDHYDALVKAIEADKLKTYQAKADIRRAFGEPLQVKTLEDNAERWLYRYAVFHQAKTKVYLYFTGEELVRFEQKSNELMGGDDK